MRKPRTAKGAVNLWLIDNRKRLGLKPPDVAKRLDVSESTVRGWEAGRSIGPESITGLEQLFGLKAPDGAAETSGDMAALVSAISDLVTEMRLARERDQDAAAAMLRAAEVLLQARQPGADEASTEPAVPLGTER